MNKADVFYQAMLARDYRFDGKFFVGVKTTGIYCRPICPAKPKRENVEFFLSSSVAEKSGYRPCLRCRPESAPLSPAWFGKSAVVQRALRAISSDGFFESSEDEFAEQFGVTARHLRRLFVEEVGLTPKQIAFNNRLNFARKLIVESDLSMISVAEVSGFASLRRFNDAFKQRFQRAPSALRKRGKQSSENGTVELSLSYRPPFDWQHLLAFYETHLMLGIDAVVDNGYERVFRIGKTVGSLRVTEDPTKPQLRLQVCADDPSVLFTVAQRVRKMFDLDSDPLLIANAFQADSVFNALWKKYPGLRVARGWDPFEVAICTILGQLVSLQQATTLKKQLIENYGEKISHPVMGEECRLFPTPEVLATADLKEVRTSEARKKSIREFAKLVLSKELDLHYPENTEISRKKLLDISGIGAWSSEYIHLRGLGDADAFPGTDLVLKKALQMYPNINLEAVRPWRSYAAIYLWKSHASLPVEKKGKTK